MSACHWQMLQCQISFERQGTRGMKQIWGELISIDARGTWGRLTSIHVRELACGRSTG